MDNFTFDPNREAIMTGTDVRDTYWTIAYRKPRANRFQRATDFASDWDGASAMARVVGAAHPDLDVWITTTAEAERVGYTHAEDRGNILTSSGKRVRVFDTGSLSELVDPTTPVWLDATPEDERDDNPQLALQADHVTDRTWNGHPIPAVTEAEMQRFITAHAVNDPNGAWGGAEVKVYADCLVIGWEDDSESEEQWPTGGVDASGATLYAIDGWTWSL